MTFSVNFDNGICEYLHMQVVLHMKMNCLLVYAMFVRTTHESVCTRLFHHPCFSPLLHVSLPHAFLSFS